MSGVVAGARVVAVDGPAAAGKGTLSRRLAGALGVAYLDTGLLYRAAGRLVLVAGGDPGDAAAAERAEKKAKAPARHAAKEGIALVKSGEPAVKVAKRKKSA